MNSLNIDRRERNVSLANNYDKTQRQQIFIYRAIKQNVEAGGINDVLFNVRLLFNSLILNVVCLVLRYKSLQINVKIIYILAAQYKFL